PFPNTGAGSDESAVVPASPEQGAGDARMAKLWWAVPAATVLVLVALAMLFGSGSERREHGSSYDASPRGFRAAYLLLDELGFPVTRSRRLGNGFSFSGAGVEKSGVRWLLFPKKSTEKDVALLDHWVRQGGVLLLADDAADFARQMGTDMTVQVREDPGEERGSGLGLGQVAVGKTWVDWPGQTGEVLAHAGGKPVNTI